MNWEQMEGQWKQWKGQLKEHWGLLVADFDLVLDGRREQSLGRKLEQHGHARQLAEEKFRDLCNRC